MRGGEASEFKVASRAASASLQGSSSPVDDDPPKCGVFLLPFFGGALAGMFALRFIGVLRPPVGRPVPPPGPFRLRPPLPPFIGSSQLADVAQRTAAILFTIPNRSRPAS